MTDAEVGQETVARRVQPEKQTTGQQS
jgi:hypothetical protein